MICVEHYDRSVEQVQYLTNNCTVLNQLILVVIVIINVIK